MNAIEHLQEPQLEPFRGINMSYSISRHTYRKFTADLDDVELDLEFDPVDDSMLVHRDDAHIVIAYLVHDEDCEHPLESCDGMGKVIGRGKYQTRRHDESEMFEALGLDRYGDPRLDLVEDKVQAEWIKCLNNLDSDTWSELIDTLGHPVPKTDEETEAASDVIQELKATLEKIDIINEGEPTYALMEAVYRVDALLADDFQIRAAAKLIDFDVESVQNLLWQDALNRGEIGDPDAVLLDVYDHSGLHWSVSGGGMQCRWDTSRGAGVWVPDDCARDEILRRAPVYAYYMIVHNHGMMRRDKYRLLDVTTTNHNMITSGSDWYGLWKQAKELAAAKPEPTPLQLAEGRRMAAIQMAEECLESYNDWLSGACYGCVVETFKYDEDTEAWCQTDQDACWGHIGSDYAEETLKSEFFNPAVAALKAAA